MLLGQALDPGREPQRLETRHFARDDTERERDLAALPERIDAETRQAGSLVGRVELARLLEVREASRRVGADLAQDFLEVLRIERLPIRERLEFAVEADDRRLSDLEVDVARATIDSRPKNSSQLEGGRSMTAKRGHQRVILWAHICVIAHCVIRRTLPAGRAPRRVAGLEIRLAVC